MTPGEVDELMRDARVLMLSNRFSEARDTYAVAADAAEVIGEEHEAFYARRRAMELHVLVWARRRWPAEDIREHDIEFKQMPPKRRSRVDLSIRRRETVPRTWVYVSVGRRGDIREEERVH